VTTVIARPYGNATSLERVADPRKQIFMTPITGIARKFFEACETGKGWDGCKAYCQPNATLSAPDGRTEVFWNRR